MYIEYCPYGDLAGLHEHYLRIDKPIPEPLLWHIFESLVNVGLLMEQGGITQAKAGWTQIIHRDLKPQNAFLDLHPQPVSSGDNWAAYPTVKLGDYGLAVETSSSDTRNPGDLTGAGTPSYQAPEQIYVQGANNPPRLTSKTDVFGVGITVMRLMSLYHNVGVEDDWSAARGGSRHPSAFPQLPDEALKEYSEELVNLVYDCVDYDQRDRPSFSEVRNTILHYTQGAGGLPQNDLARGMRMNGNQQMLQIGLRYDRWAVGNPLIVPANPPVTAPPTKGPAHRYSPRDEDEEEEEDEDEEDEQDSEEAEEEEDEDS
jgi:serine/threonine protein kinase